MEAGRHAARGPTAKAEDSTLAAVEVNHVKKIKKNLLEPIDKKYILVYTCIYKRGKWFPANVGRLKNETIL